MHDLSAGGEVIEQVAAFARLAALEFGVLESAQIELMHVSENATFLISQGEERLVLRVHRLDYHTVSEIRSELIWSEALGNDIGLKVRRPVRSDCGQGVRTVEIDGLGRHCVLFEYVNGPELDRPGPEEFAILGQLAARMHRHVQHWRPTRGFVRFSWDLDACFGESPRWGNYRAAVLGATNAISILEAAEMAIRTRLYGYGASRDSYGLIHADMRLANLIWDEAHSPTVIDFDDCGYGWFLYDLAASLSFIEHTQIVPELIDAWVEGYLRAGGPSRVAMAEISTFVMMRRLLLAGWVASHQGSQAAIELGDEFADQTVELAESYLTEFG